jgi:hypothetical protein
MSILFYRRPDFVAKLPSPLTLAECQAYIDKTQKHRKAIPAELSFEKVVHNKALPVSHGRDKQIYLVLSRAAVQPGRFHAVHGVCEP